MILVGLLLSVVVIACVAVGVYWIVDTYFAPSYSRGARINDVAWGKDGSLYLRVQWVVSHDRTWVNFVEFNEDAVYRLDRDERILRMLPMEEARRVIARWPAVGWVGGRYAVTSVTRQDTATGNYTTTSELYDWNTGETLTVGPVIGISPDDRYLLWRNARGLPVVHWMESGQDVPIPDTVVMFRDVGYPSGLVEREWLLTGDTKELSYSGSLERMDIPYRSFFATDSGILDAYQKWFIDPVTYDTRPGWGPIQFGPGGIQTLAPNGRKGESHFDGGISFRGTTDMAHFNSAGDYSDPDYYEFSISSESVRWSLPDEWRDLSRFPKEYVLPGVAHP